MTAATLEEKEISIDEIKPGCKIGLSIYHPENSRLLISGKEVITKSMIEKLRKLDSKKVILKEEEENNTRYGAFDSFNNEYAGEDILDKAPDKARDIIRNKILENTRLEERLNQETFNNFNEVLKKRSSNITINRLSGTIKKITSNLRHNKKGKYVIEEFQQLETPAGLRRYLRDSLQEGMIEDRPEATVNLEVVRLFRGDETFPHGINSAKWGGLLASYINMINSLKGIDFRYDLPTVLTSNVLHDIGKVKIDDEILYSRKRFTKESEERKVLEKHPEYGKEILEPYEDILGMHPIRVAYEHHEKPDGTGYPAGKRSEEIDPYSKLMTVVDLFDAVYFKRNYRKGLFSERETLDIVLSELYGEKEIFFNTYKEIGTRYTEKEVEKDEYYPLALGLIKITGLVDLDKIVNAEYR